MRRRVRQDDRELPSHLRAYVPAVWGFPRVLWLDGLERFERDRQAWLDAHPSWSPA